MKRYFDFFCDGCNPQKIEVEGGCFEIRPVKCEKEVFSINRQLVFISEKDGKEVILHHYVRRMKPFGKEGIACDLFHPMEEGEVSLFFFADGKVHAEKGYITDPRHLYYTYKGDVLVCDPDHQKRLILSKKDLETYGFCEEIYFEREHFWFPSTKKELVSKQCFTYDGVFTDEPKKREIARRIMIRIHIFLANSVVFRSKEEEKNHVLSGLTWDARTAEMCDVKTLYDLEASEDNLNPENALQMKKVIELFEEGQREHLFSSYMEFFFTAYENLSDHKKWSDSQLIPHYLFSKELDDFHTSVYQNVHGNMAAITKEFFSRPDFERLLERYEDFEAAFADILKKYNLIPEKERQVFSEKRTSSYDLSEFENDEDMPF